MHHHAAFGLLEAGQGLVASTLAVGNGRDETHPAAGNQDDVPEHQHGGGRATIRLSDGNRGDKGLIRGPTVSSAETPRGELDRNGPGPRSEASQEERGRQRLRQGSILEWLGLRGWEHRQTPDTQRMDDLEEKMRLRAATNTS